MAADLVKASSEYIDQTANRANLDITNGSISFWFNLTSAGQGAFSYAFQVGNDSQNWCIFGNSTGSWADESLSWRGGGSNLIMGYRNGHTFLMDDTDHHAVIIADGVDNRIMIDGVDVGVSYLLGNATTANGLWVSGINNLYCGGDPGGNGILGQFWDMRIYNRGLSDNECKIIYEEHGADGITNGVLLRMNLDEGTDGSTMTTAIDLSGNGYNGTPQNTPAHKAKPTRNG